MLPNEISETIWKLIEAIDRLQWPLDTHQEFGTDLSLGAVKFEDSNGDQKRYRIRLAGEDLEIQEDGRESTPQTTCVRLLLGQEIVFEGIFNLIVEDENEWIFQGSTVSTLHEGPWIKDLAVAQERLDRARQARAAERHSEQASKSLTRINKQIQRRRKRSS